MKKGEKGTKTRKGVKNGETRNENKKKRRKMEGGGGEEKKKKAQCRVCTWKFPLLELCYNHLAMVIFELRCMGKLNSFYCHHGHHF